MKNGVTFGGKHSIDDWDLLMIDKSIPDADPRLEFLSIPGSDTVYDLTEDYGRVLYNQRTLSFTFDIFADSDEWWTIRKAISSHVNGKLLKIILDQEPTHYFIGRCRVSGFTNLTTVATIKIDAVCDPYRYKHNETAVVLNVSGSHSGALANEGKKVAPEITTTSPIGVTINKLTKQLSAGTFKFADFMLSEGDNPIAITGTASVKIRYQEGVL